MGRIPGVNSENVMLDVFASLQNNMSRIPAVYSEHWMLDVVPSHETLQAVYQPYLAVFSENLMLDVIPSP